MKQVFLVFLFLSFVFLGMQDMMSIGRHEIRAELPQQESIKSPDYQPRTRFAGAGNESVFYYNGNSEYVRLLSRISQGDEESQVVGGQLRLFHKFISASYLKSFNSKLRTSELVSSFVTITQSALHYRCAHLIFLLRRIVI